MARRHDRSGTAGPRLLLGSGSILFAGLSVAAAVLAIRGWDPLASAPTLAPVAPAAVATPLKPPPSEPAPAPAVPAPVSGVPVAAAAPPEPAAAPLAEPKSTPPAAVPVQKPAPTPAAPEPDPPSDGLHAVQIGAFPGQAEAEQTWAATRARLAALLNGRPHRVDGVEVDGRQVFRLLITGFASPAEAQSFCRRLRSAGQDCFARP